MHSKLALNINDFVVSALQYSRKCFQSSFNTQSFYKTGQPWPSRESKWGKKRDHPILFLTGALFNSFAEDPGIFRYDKKKCRVQYTIRTTEENQGQKKNRRYKGIGYAAVHNTDPKYQIYTVNGNCNRKPLQRQFMGLNPYIDEHINQHFLPDIFKGFP